MQARKAVATGVGVLFTIAGGYAGLGATFKALGSDPSKVGKQSPVTAPVRALETPKPQPSPTPEVETIVVDVPAPAPSVAAAPPLGDDPPVYLDQVAPAPVAAPVAASAPGTGGTAPVPAPAQGTSYEGEHEGEKAEDVHTPEPTETPEPGHESEHEVEDD